MSSRSLSVPLSAPAPGRAALVRARRILHEGAATRGDIVYRVYVVVLLGAMFVVPAISGVTSTVPAEHVTGLVWAMRGWCAVVVVLAALAPTHFGPVITYEGELHFLVTGPFGARRVLSGRTWTVALAAMVATGALAATVSAGLGLSSVAVVASTAWIVGLSALVVLGLMGIQTRWGSLVRPVLALAGGAVFVVARLGERSPWVPGGREDLLGAVVLGAFVVVALALVPPALTQVLPRVMEHDIRMRRLIGSGLTVGDVKALTTRDGPRRRWGRRRTLALDRGLLPRSLAVSALDLLRTPARTALALVVLGTCGAWVGATAGGLVARVAHAGSGATDLSLPVVVLAPIALVASQWAFAVLAGALVDVLETVGAHRLDPTGFWVQAAALLALPAILLVVAVALGAGACLVLTPVTLSHVPDVVAGIPVTVSVVVAAVAVVVLVGPAMALALSASGAAPLMAFASSASPVGGMASLWVVAWMLRGLAPAVVLALALVTAVRHGSGAGSALVGCVLVLVVVCGAAVGLHLRHLEAEDRRARGEAPVAV